MKLSNKYCYKIIYDNFIDYVCLDKYRSIKLLLDSSSTDKINIKNKFGYNVLDYMLKNNINYNVSDIPISVCKNINLFTNLELVYNKYCKHSLYQKFINKCDLSKVTEYNLENLFQMFIITQNFKGFQEWGPGNNKNVKDNILNHYNKHKHEKWEKSLSLNEYCDYAINISKVMTNKICHTNGTKVYLCGFYGKVLVIGRLHNNMLGISSCYVVNDNKFAKKLLAFNNNLCWHV